jgi:16S rRNA (cytidine1402-2'-O)-methyltransferase
MNLIFLVLHLPILFFTFTESIIKKVAGKLFLIPVTLGDNDYRRVIPDKVLEITRNLRVFVAEEIRSARRYLRLIDPGFPIDSSVFLELNEHTGDNEIEHCLDLALKGSDIGIISEAGLPGIADPGSKLVILAHKRKIQVVPLSGPSSIIMALIASGLNGQNFAFNGYLPVKPSERASKVKELEKRAREGFSQIFMETPYRNRKMLETVLSVCNSETRLCIAVNISHPDESIRTLPVSEWKRAVPDLDNRLAVFIIQ